MTDCAGQAKLRRQNPKRPRMSAPLQIGIVLFPRVTQLDFTGPLQCFQRARRAGASDLETDRAVPSDSVLVLTPTVSFADCRSST